MTKGVSNVSKVLKDTVKILSLAKTLNELGQTTEKIEILGKIVDFMKPYVHLIATPISMQRGWVGASLGKEEERYTEKGIEFFSLDISYSTLEKTPTGHEIWLLTSGNFLTVKTKEYSYDPGIESADGAVYQTASNRWIGDSFETPDLPKEILATISSWTEVVWKIRYASFQIFRLLDIDESQWKILGEILNLWSMELSEPRTYYARRIDNMLEQLPILLSNLPFTIILKNAEKALKCLLKCYHRASLSRKHYSAFLKKLCDRRPDLLAHMLEDKDWEIRFTAIKLLAERADENTFEAFIQALNRQHPDSSSIIFHLTKIKSKDKRAVEPLINALTNEKKEVRERAAKALGELGDKRAVEPLIQTLKDHLKKPYESNSYSRRKEEEVLKEVIGGLNKLDPDERILIPLLEIVQASSFKDLSGNAREYADHNLNEIFTKIGEKISEKSIDHLLQFCTKNLAKQSRLIFRIPGRNRFYSNVTTLGYAINAIFSIGNEKAIQALIQIYEKSKEAKAKNVEDLVWKKLEEIGRRPKSWSGKLFGR